MSTQDPTRSPSPRDRLRARHDEQLMLLSTFFGFDAKIARARATLGALEADQRAALAELAASTSVEVASDLTGLTRARVRDAMPGRRSPSAPAGTGGAQGRA